MLANMTAKSKQSKRGNRKRRPSGRWMRYYRGARDLPVFEDFDTRTREALAYRAALADLIADLGGEGVISRVQLERCRNAAAYAVLIGPYHVAICQGARLSENQIASLTAMTNAQDRQLKALPSTRVARDVTPHLHDYIAAKAAE